MPVGISIPRASTITGAVGRTNGPRIDVGPLGVMSEPGDDPTDDEADMFEGDPGVEFPDNPKLGPL